MSETKWLRAAAKNDTIGVDRENEVLHGFVVVEQGVINGGHDGEFDAAALKSIVKLMKAERVGLKSRFSHPTLSDDGLGKFLGRAHNPRLSTVGDDMPAVRADLYLDPTSHTTPAGDLGGYVLDLADSDPAALSSSMVLSVEREFRIDKKGRPQVDEAGDQLPPLWRPVALHATDIVDEGAAVGSLLSASVDMSRLPDAIAREGCEMLDRQFADRDPEYIREHCRQWLDRYLLWRFGEDAQLAVMETEGDPETPYDPDRDREVLRRRRALEKRY